AFAPASVSSFNRSLAPFVSSLPPRLGLFLQQKAFPPSSSLLPSTESLLVFVFVFNRRVLSFVSRFVGFDRFDRFDPAVKRRGLRGSCGGSRGGRRACPRPWRS